MCKTNLSLAKILSYAADKKWNVTNSSFKNWKTV